MHTMFEYSILIYNIHVELSRRDRCTYSKLSFSNTKKEEMKKEKSVGAILYYYIVIIVIHCTYLTMCTNESRDIRLLCEL